MVAVDNKRRNYSTTFSIQELCAPLHVMLLLLHNVLMEKLSVTWELMLGAGWEIIAYQKVSEYWSLRSNHTIIDN